MSSRGAILRSLADGRFHSGAELGRALGISRAAVNKAVQALLRHGLEVHSVAGRGYRLAHPFTPLEHERILVLLATLGERQWRGRLEVLEAVDSTNLYLLQKAPPELADGQCCIAESQSGGRGRRGRRWVSTPYRNLLFSMAWTFEGGPQSAAGLSLAAGVAVLRTLQACGIGGVGLKWPNDVVWQERKLAGILIDVRGEAAGPCQTVLGVGLNVHLDERDAAAIDQPWVDLYRLTGQIADRNRIAALLILHCTEVLREFARSGLEAFRREWLAHHAYGDRPLRLWQGGREYRGVMQGIDASGAILLRDAGGRTQAFHAGEISLRPQP
jgi:BirA family biotin operon repressor/biotin-[acetyl-CoA-carboxylase] ligase